MTAREIIKKCKRSIDAFEQADRQYRKTHNALGKAIAKTAWRSLDIYELGVLVNLLPEGWMDRRHIYERIYLLGKAEKSDQLHQQVEEAGRDMQSSRY